jgi:flagellin-like protein
MVERKGISPMIAIVLLIAFTVAVGGILSVWLTTLTSTQTTTTGSAAEKQILCARSVLKISEVTSTLGSSDYSNVTVIYDYGTEDLYNFTITFVDSDRDSATTNNSLTPQYNNSAGQHFSPGEMVVWQVTPAHGLDLGGSSLYSVRVRALCQGTYPVSSECNTGQSCMS